LKIIKRRNVRRSVGEWKGKRVRPTTVRSTLFSGCLSGRVKQKGRGLAGISSHPVAGLLGLGQEEKVQTDPGHPIREGVGSALALQPARLVR
jgi:hypothetical protein